MDSPIVALLDRVRHGDDMAVRELVERFGPAVQRELRFRMIDQRLGRFVLGSDLIQSTLTRFLLGLQLGRFQLRNSDDLRRVLRTLARRQVVDSARYWKADRRDVRRNRQLDMDGDSVRSATTSADTPSRILAYRELIALALSRIGPLDRQIAAWRQGGLGWQEILERCPGFPSAEALRKAHQRTMRQIALEIGIIEGPTGADGGNQDDDTQDRGNGDRRP
jgi:hypothetical protein